MEIDEEDTIKTLLQSLVVKMDLQADRSAALESRLSILEGERTLDKDDERDDGSHVSARERQSRKTRFQKDLEDVSAAEEKRMVVINMPPPDFKHIFLDSTDLADFSNFLIQWMEWESTYSLKLEPPRILSKRLRSLLMHNHEVSEADFYKMTPTDFMKLMAKETKVMSKREFGDTMRHALRYMKPLNWEKVNPANHQRFYQGILRRKDLFTKVFQILMENNKEYCPELKGKKYGLAQIFLDLIAQTYNESILAEIPEINRSNYVKIDDFIEKYVEQAKHHYEVACGMKRVPYVGSQFRSIDSTSNERDHSTKNVQRKESDNKQGLNNMHYHNQDAMDGDDEELEISPVVEVPEESDLEATDEDDGDLQRKMDDLQPCSSHDETEMRLLAIPGDKMITRGCINFAVYGNCFKGSECRNAKGHNEASAKETRQWLMKKLATIEREGYPKVLKRDQTRA